MTKTTVIRIAAGLQLIFSAVLLAATVFAYSSYRSSLSGFTLSISASVRSAADLIGKVADTIALRQELVGDSTRALQSSRELVAAMRVSAERQGKLLPQYAGDLRNAAAIASDLGVTVTKIGNVLLFRLPTNVHMEGIKPAVEWSRPLQAEGLALQSHGNGLKALSDSLKAISASVTSDVQDLNAAFIEASTRAIAMLERTTAASEGLGAKDLPQIIASLKAASQQLRDASEQARGVETFANSILLACLAIACLFACNGIVVLLIAAPKASTP